MKNWKRNETSAGVNSKRERDRGNLLGARVDVKVCSSFITIYMYLHFRGNALRKKMG
jgi:hypothetical protein